MKSIAVELNDEVSVWPGGIHLESFDDRVDSGRWQTGLMTEIEEQTFELGASDQIREPLIVEKSTQGSQPMSAMIGDPEALDRPHVQQLETLRFLEGTKQRLWLEHLREIEQGPSDGGDGDLVPPGAILGSEVTDRMHS